MHEPDSVRVQVLPRPVERRELTVVFILLRDVISRIVRHEARNRLCVQRRPDLDRQIAGPVRHRAGPVAGDQNLDSLRHLVPPCVWYLLCPDYARLIKAPDPVFR